MTERRKVSPVEAWSAIDAMSAQQDLERIKALDAQDVDRELAEAGFDPAEARTIGQDAIEAAAREAGIATGPSAPSAPSAQPAPPGGRRGTGARTSSPPRAPRRALWIAIAAAAAIAVALVAVALVNDGATVASPNPGPTPRSADAAPPRPDAGDAGGSPGPVRVP